MNINTNLITFVYSCVISWLTSKSWQKKKSYEGTDKIENDAQHIET